jgi:2-methylcitrate dehydratase PrpD
MAGGIIEYLAEGAWTKRLHPGWAAQSGLRAALLGRQGFLGPRTVFEGVHGFVSLASPNTTNGNYAALIGDFGAHWVTQTLAFKPYPCGTMTHPLHRLRTAAGGAWDQGGGASGNSCARSAKARCIACGSRSRPSSAPANGYAGKFSTPYCIAHAFVRGQVGLDAFTDDAVQEPDVLALASKVRYQIDPQNPYPNNFTGHIRAALADGRVVEERQPHLRGGAHEPLSRGDIEEKFVLNARHGGWDAARSERALALPATLYDGKLDLSSLRGERQRRGTRSRSTNTPPKNT